MQLRELQESFQAHLLRGDEAFAASIADTPALSPAQRLGIYSTAYVARLREALKSSFVKLHLILGDDTFAAMAAGFIAAHPSATRSIRWFGQRLPEYLQLNAPYSAQPILAELARFEWALTECFDAADAHGLTRDDLAQVDPSRWGELRFDFHPAVRTLSLEYNAVEVWKALDADSQATPPDPRKLPARITWLLWRQEFQNRFRSIDAAEAAALAWAMDGADFAKVCEHLGRMLPEDQVPVMAATLVSNWSDTGILIRPAT